MQRSFADATNVLQDVFRSFLPPEPITVAEWAGKNRWLNNPGGGYVGRWDNAKAPYLVEPMEALTSDVLDVVLVGPGQSGKSEAGNNWMLHSIDVDPASYLRFMQTDDALRSYVKDKINPLIDEHEQIKSKLGPRPVDDSIGFKRFRGMNVQFLAAVRSNLISKSAPRIIVDEEDNYDAALGDVKNLIDVRRQTFGRDSKALFISHPDRAAGLDPAKWQAGIMSHYADSTRCTWWWQCPHCAATSSPNPGSARHMALEYPETATLDVIAAEARLVCPVNGCLIADGERAAMNATGRWIGMGQTIDEAGNVAGERVQRDIAGYWIVGAMSPFLLHGIGGLAAARVKAERAVEAGEDDKSLNDVLTKQWGFTRQSSRRIGSLDAVALADRTEPGLRLSVVPGWVRFLTAAADVQGNRFEGLVRGWGVGAESAVLAHWIMVADTATSPSDWDDMLSRLLAPLPLADGSGRVMRVHAAGFDSGGKAGVTLQAYDAWRRAKKAGAARLRGKIDGRDAWTLLPLKGLSGVNAGRLAVVYPDSKRKDRFAGAGGTVPLGQFAPNLFKDDLAVQLAKMDGTWSVHVPAELRGDHTVPADKRSGDPPHTFFEQLVAESRSPRGVWENVGRQRNEAMDLMVMAHVVAHLHGLPRLRWDAPRSWFAPQDSNSAVYSPTAKPPEAAPLAPPVSVQMAVEPQAAPSRAAEKIPTPGMVTVQQPARRSFFSRLA